MTTNQTTTGTTSEQLHAVPSHTDSTKSGARQAVTTARTKASAATSKAGNAVRSNPKSSAAGLLALAGAAAAAIFLNRRRTAKSRSQSRLRSLLHR
ncbi:hypothetical protein AB0F81_45790 [Actinoplanes sp. NPDC024001]|uniref:hypothetical protein n=1 Tax=Actinoplanes sp. NPDC024001 TaxID=3154598 RepID=UPI0033DF4A54